MKQTIFGYFVSIIDLSWLFNWIIWLSRPFGMFAEVFIVCGIIFQSYTLYYGVAVLSETQGFYYKRFPLDVSFMSAIDMTFDTDVSIHYVNKYYPSWTRPNVKDR